MGFFKPQSFNPFSSADNHRHVKPNPLVVTRKMVSRTSSDSGDKARSDSDASNGSPRRHRSKKKSLASPRSHHKSSPTISTSDYFRNYKAENKAPGSEDTCNMPSISIP